MNRPDELDRDLDAALRRAFAPPPAADLEQMARAVAAPRRAHRRWPWLTLAAAALLVATLLFADRRPRGPEGHDGVALGAMWAEAYADAMQRGFGGTCCESGFDMPQACHELFARRIDVVGTGSVRVVGSYCGLDTGGCMTVLARDGDLPVCVYMMPATADPGVVVPAGSGLQLVRRELDGVVLYALAAERADGALAQFVAP